MKRDEDPDTMSEFKVDRPEVVSVSKLVLELTERELRDAEPEAIIEEKEAELETESESKLARPKEVIVEKLEAPVTFKA